MTRAGIVFLLLLVPVPSGVSAQQSSSAPALPLVVTDRQAVEEWSRAAQGQQPLDPKAPADTEFLLSLTDAERLGAFRYRQRCVVCHGRQMSLAPNTWGPLLSKTNVEGREDAVRTRINEGSARMPAFKYALQPAEVDAIIDYLKKLQNP
jgi:mono/diheme cytochrome c family protein